MKTWQEASSEAWVSFGGQGPSGQRWHCTSSKAIGMSSSRAFMSRACSPVLSPRGHSTQFLIILQRAQLSTWTTGFSRTPQDRKRHARGCSPPVGRRQGRPGATGRPGQCPVAAAACLQLCVTEVGKKAFLVQLPAVAGRGRGPVFQHEGIENRKARSVWLPGLFTLVLG